MLRKGAEKVSSYNGIVFDIIIALQELLSIPLGGRELAKQQNLSVRPFLPGHRVEPACGSSPEK